MPTHWWCDKGQGPARRVRKASQRRQRERRHTVLGLDLQPTSPKPDWGDWGDRAQADGPMTALGLARKPLPFHICTLRGHRGPATWPTPGNRDVPLWQPSPVWPWDPATRTQGAQPGGRAVRRGWRAPRQCQELGGAGAHWQAWHPEEPREELLRGAAASCARLRGRPGPGRRGRAARWPRGWKRQGPRGRSPSSQTHSQSVPASQPPLRPAPDLASGA